jgi:cytochrome P450
MGSLSGRPDAISRAIAEGLRYVAPVPATVRIAARDSSVKGYEVAAGERLVILTCNLARDAGFFPDPDRFDASRVHDPRARNLWYGAGPHFCLGFAVAQRELHLTLDALLAEPGELRIVRRRVGVRRLLAGYSSLQIRLDLEGGR